MKKTKSLRATAFKKGVQCKQFENITKHSKEVANFLKNNRKNDTKTKNDVSAKKKRKRGLMKYFSVSEIEIIGLSMRTRSSALIEKAAGFRSAPDIIPSLFLAFSLVH